MCLLLFQDLVEKVMLLRHAVEGGQGNSSAGGALAQKLSQYAELLAAEGSLATAATYLGNSQEVREGRNEIEEGEGDRKRRERKT